MELALIGLHIATAHMMATAPMNDHNPGVYIKTTSGITAGAYRSSINTDAVYAGYTTETQDRRWALTVGAVHGYKGAFLKPLLVPSLAVDLTSMVRARVSFLAKAEKGGAAGIHFSLELPVSP